MTIHQIVRHMEAIGADGVHVSTVESVANGLFKLAKRDCGEGHHKDHYHFIELGRVAGVEGQRVRLSANAAVAVTFELESVETGDLHDRLQVIRSGLAADDRVITDGIVRAVPGGEVTPQDGAIADGATTGGQG